MWQYNYDYYDMAPDELMHYGVLIGNDTDGTNHGYKIHLVYGCTAAPSSVNESPEADEMSWEISTVPVDVPGFKPTATLVINSTETDAATLKKIEDLLYGTEEAEARLPLPAEIITLLGAATNV